MTGEFKRGSWSFAEQRRLIEMAAASKTLEDIADELKRPAESVLRMARHHGVTLKGRKAKAK
jgi:hypothetical protein